MGKKTLYVHIGTPKTGTTALQVFLWRNREVLKRKGYCYPSMRKAYGNIAAIPERRNGHFLVNDAIINGSRDHEEEDEAMYRAGMDEIGRLFEGWDNIVLSDEAVWASTYKQRENLWEELKADGGKYGFEVKIIAYLRRQDQHMMSLYRQKVKERRDKQAHKTWEDFITHIEKVRQLDYFEKLERIRKVLGKEAMIICRYDRGGFYGGSIYADFMHRIGLEYTDEYVIEKEEANRSLTGNAVEIKRMLNELEDFNVDDNFVINQVLLAGCENPRKELGTELFSREETEAFLKKYEESNELVAKTYFDDGKPLFDMPIRDLQKYDPDNPYMMEDILRFAANALKYARREQAQQMEELRKQVEQLQSQAVQKQEIINLRKELYATREKLHHPVRTVVSKIRKS